MNKQEIEKAIEYFRAGNFLGKSMDKHINVAISVLEQQLNGGWIPASERLPTLRQYEEGEPIEYNIMLKGAEVPTTGCINEHGEWGEMCWAKGIFYPFMNEVIAWCPLPEPYKEAQL